jgi:hypothetical protein
MPFLSEAQRRWGHTAEGEKALGGAAKVAEWDEATKGKHIPKRVSEGRRSQYREIYTQRKKDGMA